MSFDLLDRPLVWIPVVWPGLAPAEDGQVAKVVEHSIELQVEIVQLDEIKRIFYPPEDGEKVEDFDAFKILVFDWRKIVAKGKPVQFTDDNIRALLNVARFPIAFHTAYLKACNGSIVEREKNSEGSPSDGPAVEPTSAIATAKP